MSERNLIGIWMNSISTNLHSFAEHGRYRTVVEVVYKINEGPPQEMHLSCPLEVLQRNMPYQKLENIMKNSDGDIAAMSIPSKAYKQMQRIVNREVDKVLADMAISVIVRIIEELDSGAENIFFIENQNNHRQMKDLKDILDAKGYALESDHPYAYSMQYNDAFADVSEWLYGHGYKGKLDKAGFFEGVAVYGIYNSEVISYKNMLAKLKEEANSPYQQL